MKNFGITSIKVIAFIIVSGVLILSCKKDDDDSTPPGKVTELSSTPGIGEVSLLWTDPVDEDLSQIEINVTPGGFLPANIAAGTENVTITNLTNGTEYTFSLIAVDDAGNKSDTVSVIGTPNTRFRVEDPELASANSQDFSIESGTNKVIVEVTLNRAVDPATVVPGETIYILYGTSVVSGTVAYSNNDKTITFTTTEAVAEWCNFTPDCLFKFVLVGNDAGQGVIKDTGDMTIDGDDDGTIGGNYEINLILLG
jgi:hypothetical protein